MSVSGSLPYLIETVHFALHRRAATYFLCFAKESRQRKATPRRRFGCAKLPVQKAIFAAGLNSRRLSPPLKHASPFFRTNAFLNGCFKGIGRMK
ncbi:MAG: hypothetical protein Q4G42_06730 [Neisseria sp.]|nr:hypothetical protein [Neisseria sp.]